MLVGVEFVGIEAVLGGCGTGSGLRDDEAVVSAVGTVVGLSPGCGAEQPLEGGERSVRDVTDAVDPVPGQRSRRRGANSRQGGRTLRSQERGDVVRRVADDGG